MTAEIPTQVENTAEFKSRTLNKHVISVIIPHLNQPDGLEACLSSLDAQSLPRELFETIVVDNGSATLPVEVVARHPNVRLLREARPGPGPARNTGAAATSSEILAFIDADCRADPDWLSNLVKALRSSPQGTILGGDVRIWQSDGGALDPMPMMQLFDKQVQLRMGQANVRAWSDDILALLQQDEDVLGVESFATHHLPLDQAPQAYADFRDKKDGMVKVLFKP